MAKFFTTCTYPNVLALFSLTVCVMLATSAPTVHVRQVSGCDQRGDIYNNVTTLVSSNISYHWYTCILCIVSALCDSMQRIVQCFLELSKACVD